MLVIKPYGIVISLAILAGFWIGYLRRKKYRLSIQDLENLFLLVVPFGIVGARLYHVFDKWGYYSQHLLEIFTVWNGGLGIYGAVGGGIAGLLIFTVIENKNVMPNLFRHPSKILKQVQDDRKKIMNLLDFLMPSLAIGQAIGRWGNFANHEVFGGPTNLPWKWFIPQNLRPEMWKNYSYFHPTFAYESLWALLGFVILLIIELSLRAPRSHEPDGTWRSGAWQSNLSKNRLLRRFAPRNDNKTHALSPAPGLFTGFYAIWYGIGRFFFEFLRFDTAEIGGIKVAQIISLCLVIGGWWLVKKSLSSKGKALV